MVLDVLREFRAIAQGRALEITELTPTVVLGDPDRLKQLVLAIIDNALKYTTGAGKIGVGIRRTDTTVEVTISDGGIGISSWDLPHVFERFDRAGSARSRNPGGTGLGLPIARWIARQHGGDVVLESVPGTGSTVIIQLPLPPQPPT